MLTYCCKLFKTANSRRRNIIAVIAMTGVLLAGCGSTKAATSSSKTTALSPLPIKIGVIINQNAPFAIAQKENYFRQFGLSPTIDTFTSGPSEFAALASHSIDIADIGLSVTAVAASQGVDLTIVGVAFDATNSDGLITHSGVTSIAQLRGKAVAAPKGSAAYLLLLSLLKQANMTLSDIKYVNLAQPAMIPAWDHGDVAAVVIWAPVMFEFPGGHVIATWKTVHHADADVWAVPASSVGQESTIITRFLRAMNKADSTLASDPSLGYQLEASRLQTNLTVGTDTVKATGFPDAKEQVSSGYQLSMVNSRSGLASVGQREADQLATFGFIPKAPNMAAMVNSEFIKAAAG